MINSPILSTNLKNVVERYVQYLRRCGILSASDAVFDEIFNIVNDYGEYRKEVDEIVLVCDRDKYSFVDAQFDKVITACKDNQIQLYLTNPCIEFWFLLHHTDCKEYSEEELLENKVISNRTFVFRELKKKDSKYDKKNINMDFYVVNLSVVCENASLYEQKIENLKNKVGSNLPMLIKKFHQNNFLNIFTFKRFCCIISVVKSKILDGIML